MIFERDTARTSTGSEGMYLHCIISLILCRYELVAIGMNVSRNLYVAINFYGSRMDPNVTVWHGLSEKMVFKGFSAYFDCPTSTTTEKIVASATFAGGGMGIVLGLKLRDTESPCIALDVTRFSRFPSGLSVLLTFTHLSLLCPLVISECERLFLGELLMITDIFISEPTKFQWTSLKRWISAFLYFEKS